MGQQPTRRQFLASAAECGMGLAAWGGYGTNEGVAARGRVFEVAAFGAVGDGCSDDRAAIQAAIAAGCQAGPGSRVVFAPGKTYRLAPRPENFGALMIGAARGLVLDGRGATLLADPSNRILALHDSQQITVQDFQLDYAPLPFTQAELTGVDVPRGQVRLRVASGYAEPAIGGSEIYRDSKFSDCVFLDGDRHRFTHAWLRVRRVESVGRGEYRLAFHGDRRRLTNALQGQRPGDGIGLKMPFPPGILGRNAAGRYLATGVANINIAFCQGVQLQRITSFAAPNMTFNAHGSEAVVLRQCQVRRKPGTDRLIAGNSDGCHLKSLTTMPCLEDCYFEALMDDSIHIKISSNVVTQSRGRRVRLNHGDIAYNDVVLEPGQDLSFYGWEQRRHLGFAEVVAVERTRYRQVWVTLDRSLPELSEGDLAFPRPLTEARVIRCDFESQLKTAVLLRPPGVVRECTFAGVAYGVHAFFNDRIEGPVPFGIHVRDCDFHQPWIAGVATSLPHRDAAPPDTHGLTVEDSRFVIGRGPGRAIVANRQNGVSLRDLTVTTQEERDPQTLIELRDCHNVEQLRTRWKAADAAGHPTA